MQPGTISEFWILLNGIGCCCQKKVWLTVDLVKELYRDIVGAEFFEREDGCFDEVGRGTKRRENDVTGRSEVTRGATLYLFFSFAQQMYTSTLSYISFTHLYIL
jgi:hypothetical protein